MALFDPTPMVLALRFAQQPQSSKIRLFAGYSLAR
jgi:hypothetical protein